MNKNELSQLCYYIRVAPSTLATYSRQFGKFAILIEIHKFNKITINNRNNKMPC